jgi:hypothetical protein
MVKFPTQRAVSSTTQNGSSAKQSSSAAVAAAAEIAMDPTERNKMSLRLRPRLFQTDVDSKRPRKSLADLLSEYK